MFIIVLLNLVIQLKNAYGTNFPKQLEPNILFNILLYQYSK